MNLRNALLAATVMATPMAANAQAVNGLYVSLGAGVNWMQQETVKSIPGTTASGKFKSNIGPAAVVALGWGLGNGLRAEVEADYRYNSFKDPSGFAPGVNGGGNEQKVGGMFNVLYDFVGLTPWFQPYIGAGVGYQAVIEHNVHAYAPGARFAMSNGTEGSFAYQGILGAAIPVAAMPGLALTAEYRFLGLLGDRNYSATTTIGAATFTGSAKMNNNYNHSFLVGVRYNFGQAPAPVAAAPAPAPAPAVQPARSYLVFFDWDKATLTDRARQIIKEAADSSTRVQYTRLEVNGYTDTSGTPKYNQGLSVRRAQAVAAELVKNGVPRNAITIQGFGETNLLVPTGPGVREPQNRRVEIIIR
jgi:outer membrane protein OmpA-like peptidoglycan-associated protein